MIIARGGGGGSGEIGEGGQEVQTFREKKNHLL